MRTEHVRILLDKLSETTAQTKDHKGFWIMSDRINEKVKGKKEISQRYLYDLHRQMQQNLNDKQPFINAQLNKINRIAQFLGYRDYSQFESECEQPLPEILNWCFGNWWSYVRANAGDYILKAPVKISKEKDALNVSMTLQGKERKFTGTVIEKGMCLYAFLESERDKALGLVFRLGHTQTMNVIQGVFCGISSNADPIAGREVLVRETQITEYEKMQWSRHRLNDESIAPEIRQYFNNKQENCIKINQVSSFDLDDLKGV